MSYAVIVSFDRDREYEIMLHDGDIQGMDRGSRAPGWPGIRRWGAYPPTRQVRSCAR